MNGRCVRLAASAALLLLLPAGCGKDDSATPPPDPALAMTLECDSGGTLLKLRNTGGGMSEDGLFVAAFTDGTLDTLRLRVAAGDSLTCRLSNIHGGVTVTNAKWGLEAMAGDCLASDFAALLAQINPGTMLPSPLATQSIEICTYTVYASNYTADPPTFELVRTDSGLTLRYAFRHLHWDLSVIGGGLCPDFTGDIGVTSVVVDTDVLISDTPVPQVSLGPAEATITGLVVNIDGWGYGWFVEQLVSGVLPTLKADMEDAIEEALNGYFGDYIEAMITARSTCAE
jgi:hypothetical protein